MSREDTEAVVGSLSLLLHHSLLPPSNWIVFEGEFVKIFLCRDLLFSDKNTSHFMFFDSVLETVQSSHSNSNIIYMLAVEGQSFW